MTYKTESKVLKALEQEGVLRPKDLDRYGIPRKYLNRLYHKGKVERAGRGLYVLPEATPTEHQTLAEASKRVPHGIVCLLSALQFHELTTQTPFEVWLAIDRKARQTTVADPPIRTVRFSGPALKEGIETHTIGGVEIPVYSPAKTVADCFKYRNKIGLDVAIEALRDCWQERKSTMDELWHFAKICRVSNVIRPYLETIASE